MKNLNRAGVLHDISFTVHQGEVVGLAGLVGAGRTVIRQAWWITVFPGLAILMSVLGLNLVGEGLNDALNPRLARDGR